MLCFEKRSTKILDFFIRKKIFSTLDRNNYFLMLHFNPTFNTGANHGFQFLIKI